MGRHHKRVRGVELYDNSFLWKELLHILDKLGLESSQRSLVKKLSLPPSIQCAGNTSYYSSFVFVIIKKEKIDIFSFCADGEFIYFRIQTTTPLLST